ncbi:MAG: carbonic anhydrase [Rhizobiales bacterium]|nr:carbonic anhydrase [Hyphomicrobiales bacterium]
MSKNKFSGLLDGYAKFREEIYPKQKKLFKELVEKGQRPEILMISCCDSRVNSSQIFNSKPGDLFMLRNVANLVPPYQLDSGYHGTSAAIEYAVTELKVKLIIVMGHSYCGGIKAAYENKDAFAEMNEETGRGFTHQWMDMIKEISTDIQECSHGLTERDQLRKLEQENVLLSLKNLRSFKFVQEALDNDELELVGSWFDLDRGVVLIGNEETKKFHVLKG